MYKAPYGSNDQSILSCLRFATQATISSLFAVLLGRNAPSPISGPFACYCFCTWIFLLPLPCELPASLIPALPSGPRVDVPSSRKPSLIHHQQSWHLCPSYVVRWAFLHPHYGSSYHSGCKCLFTYLCLPLAPTQKGGVLIFWPRANCIVVFQDSPLHSTRVQHHPCTDPFQKLPRTHNHRPLRKFKMKRPVSVLCKY